MEGALRTDQKNDGLYAIFFLKNLVGKKKSCNFALGFGNERRETSRKSGNEQDCLFSSVGQST